MEKRVKIYSKEPALKIAQFELSLNISIKKIPSNNAKIKNNFDRLKTIADTFNKHIK